MWDDPDTAAEALIRDGWVKSGPGWFIKPTGDSELMLYLELRADDRYWPVDHGRREGKEFKITQPGRLSAGAVLRAIGGYCGDAKEDITHNAACADSAELTARLAAFEEVARLVETLIVLVKEEE